MKIFITGFQRSGTTLLENLVGLHPEVEIMLHEYSILNLATYQNATELVTKQVAPNRKKTVRDFVKFPKGFNWQRSTWGEKIPYYKDEAPEGGFHIYKYMDKWLKAFEEEAVILHIVRHPLDVIYSTYKEDRDQNPDPPATFEILQRVVPRVVEHLWYERQAMQLKYEDLVLHPRTVMQRVFEFCNLSADVPIVAVVC